MVVETRRRKGFHSLVMLVAWLLWKHRKECVFEGRTPNVPQLLHRIHEELAL